MNECRRRQRLKFYTKRIHKHTHTYQYCQRSERQITFVTIRLVLPDAVQNNGNTCDCYCQCQVGDSNENPPETLSIILNKIFRIEQIFFHLKIMAGALARVNLIPKHQLGKLFH